MSSPQPSVTTTFRSSEQHPPDPKPSEPHSQAFDVALRIAATTCYVTSDVLSIVAVNVGRLGDRLRRKILGMQKSRSWMPCGFVDLSEVQ